MVYSGHRLFACILHLLIKICEMAAHISAANNLIHFVLKLVSWVLYRKISSRDKPLNIILNASHIATQYIWMSFIVATKYVTPSVIQKNGKHINHLLRKFCWHHFLFIIIISSFFHDVSGLFANSHQKSFMTKVILYIIPFF